MTHGLSVNGHERNGMAERLPRSKGFTVLVLFQAFILTEVPQARAQEKVKPLPTHVCSPRLGDYNDRQAFIGFDDGSVQWCLSRNQCNRLAGMPDTPSRIVAFSCEREQFVWVVRADGLVYRCVGAIGRNSCERVPIQQ